MPLSVGDKLGPYKILAPSGADGMGEVYRARDTKLKRDVALKVLPEAFAFPMMTMTAAQLGEPETALRCLMMDAPHNRYTLNGHCNHRRFLAGCLPGNGGLLTALTLMAAGWDGGPRDAPGFPKNAKWQVKSERLRPLP
jgi:serine/threonine protein kinase